jgi:hypothetical protein
VKIFNPKIPQYLPLTLGVRIPLKQDFLNTKLCDKVCQWLATGRWFSPGTLVYSTNKTDCHNIFYLNNFIGYHGVAWHSVKFDIVWLKLVLTWFHFRFLAKSIKRITWVSDLRQVGGFLQVLWFILPIKLTAIT